MCGIAGIYYRDLHPVRDEELKRMTDIMKYRGPDDEGLYIYKHVGLGHRRLSIIDLSQKGHQPMSNKSGDVWITYNGEIYNYLELMAELRSLGYSFESNCDTEVIIHAYEEWHEECLHKFNGMFSFAIWDARKNHLFIARDRLGVKPFYYYIDDTCFIFASEIKSILQNENIEVKPNHSSISEYLRYNYSVSDNTFFNHIRKLMPGHYGILSSDKIKIIKYWDVEYDSDENLWQKSEDEYVTELTEILKDSVSLRLRSDVPVGSYLSGGMDSSTIVAIATHFMDRPINTFSGVFQEGKEFDERKYIQLVANKCNTTHHEIYPEGKTFAELLPSIVWWMDEPTIGAPVFSQYCVCRLASEHVKVILGGQGGDELFGGYYRYFPSFFRSNFKNNTLEFLKALLSLPGHINQVGGIRSALKRKTKYKEIENTVQKDFIKSHFNSPGHYYKSYPADPFDQRLYRDLKYYLPGLLQIEDRMSMAVSIESRLPLLDYRLVEFSAKIPRYLKLRNLTMKYILRRATQQFLPKEIVERKDKIGFTTPISKWFRNEAKELLLDTLSDRAFRERGIFETRPVNEIINEHLNEKSDRSHVLWAILNVELWHRIFVDGHARVRE